jgi:trk system potassium uptake protein TrkA
MNVIICGAGQVGIHVAEELADAGHGITVIDQDATRIRKIEDTMDVRTYCGNCAAAITLREAGCESADLLVAATSSDEINLLTATIAKGVGARKTIVRVHHSTYFEQRGLNYQQHLGIDQMICPEYSTALAIARTLRNPGAMAVENFARGRIEMQEFRVGQTASAVGIALSQLGLPRGSRLAAVTRAHETFIPDGATVIEPDDQIVLVGNVSVFPQARKLFQGEQSRHRRIVLMGGPSMAVWLCRALRERGFSIRLFEIDRARSEQLAEKLDWATVIQADPSDRNVFEEENLGQADAFVALLDDDEHNILGCAWAKSMGVRQAVAVVQRPDYLHLLQSVGIDRAFSPRMVAAKEIEQFLQTGPLRRIASLAEGIIDINWLRVGKQSKVVGRELKDIKLSPDWVVAAIQRGTDVRVPVADDTVEADDTLLVIGRRGTEGRLKKLFSAG